MPKGHEKEVSKTPLHQSPDLPKETRALSNTLQILDNHVLKTNPFGANVSGENSYRRVERIAAALHLITNHVPNEEPLRAIIRKESIELLGHVLALRSGFRSPASENVQVVLSSVRELISFARLLAVTGYVSTENVNALCEALDELGSLIIASQRSSLSDQHTVNREDLMPVPAPTPLLRTESTRKALRRKNKRPIRDITDAQGDSVSVTAGARANQILDILKLGGVLGVKDIAANLPQYSEKMIQRELASLTASEKVSKVGEKRWSKYQLIVH